MDKRYYQAALVARDARDSVQVAMSSYRARIAELYFGMF